MMPLFYYYDLWVTLRLCQDSRLLSIVQHLINRQGCFATCETFELAAVLLVSLILFYGCTDTHILSNWGIRTNLWGWCSNWWRLMNDSIYVAENSHIIQHNICLIVHWQSQDAQSQTEPHFLHNVCVARQLISVSPQPVSYSVCCISRSVLCVRTIPPFVQFNAILLDNLPNWWLIGATEILSILSWASMYMQSHKGCAIACCLGIQTQNPNLLQ